jgi:predicted O-linked N-acetylglucosamine transferase (SPINDLY family)
MLASWLGYFATTGMAQMDWLLADATGVPPEQQQTLQRISRPPHTDASML